MSSPYSKKWDKNGRRGTEPTRQFYGLYFGVGLGFVLGMVIGLLW